MPSWTPPLLHTSNLISQQFLAFLPFSLLLLLCSDLDPHGSSISFLLNSSYQTPLLNEMLQDQHYIETQLLDLAFKALLSAPLQL